MRLPTGSRDREEAIRIIREKLAKASRYVEYSEHVELVPVDQLLDLPIEDYELSNRSTTYDAERRIKKHLRPFFGNKPRYLPIYGEMNAEISMAIYTAATSHPGNYLYFRKIIIVNRATLLQTRLAHF